MGVELSVADNSWRHNCRLSRPRDTNPPASFSEPSALPHRRRSQPQLCSDTHPLAAVPHAVIECDGGTLWRRVATKGRPESAFNLEDVSEQLQADRLLKYRRAICGDRPREVILPSWDYAAKRARLFKPCAAPVLPPTTYWVAIECTTRHLKPPPTVSPLMGGMVVSLSVVLCVIPRIKTRPQRVDETTGGTAVTARAEGNRVEQPDILPTPPPVALPAKVTRRAASAALRALRPCRCWVTRTPLRN